MTDIQLQSGELWEIDGERHFFDQAMGSGFLLFRSERTGAPYQIPLDTGEYVSPSMDWLIGQFARGLVKRLNLTPNASKARKEAGLREDDYNAIVARDPRALVRQVTLSSLDRLNFSKSDRGIRQALAKIWADKPRQLESHKTPSPATVRRWLQDRGDTGNRALKVMVSLSGRVSREKRLAPSVRRRMHEEAVGYWSDHSRNVAQSYDTLVAYLEGLNRYLKSRKWRVVSVPSKEAFRQHVRSLECYIPWPPSGDWRKPESDSKPSGKGWLRIGRCCLAPWITPCWTSIW